MLKKQAIRNAEYHDMQPVLDKLYADSRANRNFLNLIELIGSPDNVILAYRNIKNNAGYDNRISLFCAQYGKCAVTGKILQYDEIHCHHKLPKCLGGTDAYKNLIIVHEDVHKLIHATELDTITKYLPIIQNEKQLSKLNELRKRCNLKEIEAVL